MNRCAGNENALGLNSVVAPYIIEVYILGKVVLKDRTVKRTYGLDGQLSRFAQQGAYRTAVLTYYIEIVTACLATPVIIVAAIESAFAQSTELTECIGTVKGTVSLIKRDHDLGPVNHGSADKAQLMLAQLQFRSLLYGKGAAISLNALKKLTQHLYSLGAGHKGK